MAVCRTRLYVVETVFWFLDEGPYVGKDLDYWGVKKWKEEMDK